MGVGVADCGASHFRLDAVQVQGAVLTSTHRHSVVGHLLARRRSQWNTILHSRSRSSPCCCLAPTCTSSSRSTSSSSRGAMVVATFWHVASTLSYTLLVLHGTVVLDRLYAEYSHSFCGGALWQFHHHLQTIRLETSSRRLCQRRQRQPQGRTLLSR